MPWLGLAGVIGWNYRRHLSGKSTICGKTREIVPPWAFLVGWRWFSRWMERHIIDGYD